MRTHFKWMILAVTLIFLAASIAPALAQQRDQMQGSSRQQTQPRAATGQDAGAGDQPIYDVLEREHGQIQDLLKEIGDSS